MSGTWYLKNRLPLLIGNVLCMIGLSIFLLINENSVDTVVLILLFWVLILFGQQCYGLLHRKRQMDRLLETAEALKERYLISEVMEKPRRADDWVFYKILRMADKSMLEQVGAVKQERVEYKEYIEQWIHEVKTPITAMKLLCENNPSSLTRELLLELEKVNRFTEQALYYARSEFTEKDFYVRELRLLDVVHQSIADNKRLLLQHGIEIQILDMDCSVYSDEKWVRFMLI